MNRTLANDGKQESMSRLDQISKYPLHQTAVAGFCHVNRQTHDLLLIYVMSILRKVSYLRFPGAKLNDYLDQAVRLFDYVQHHTAYQGSCSPA